MTDLEGPPGGESHASHSAYDISEWQGRQIFVRQVEEICVRQGIDLQWMSEKWIARLERDGRSCHVAGYIFPLNNAVADALMQDKVSTSVVLQRNGVPAVEHKLLRLPAMRETPGMAEQAARLAGFPMVVKPCSGEMGGFDVCRCDTVEEARDAIDSLSRRHRTLAISPFIEIDAEFRTLVLDGEPLLTFEKVRAPLTPDGTGEWRHNLKLGAAPELQTDPTVCVPLGGVAVAAMVALQGRLGVVDIARTATGLQVIEMNSGFSLSRFSAYKPEYATLTRAVYTTIIEESLKI